MTRLIHTTDLREITALTITCAECGAAFRMPVDRPFRVEQCNACNARLILDEVNALALDLHRLNAPQKRSFTVTFETVETDA